MSVRTFIGRHPAVVVAAIVLSVAGAAAYAVTQLRGSPPPPIASQFYFIPESGTRLEECFPAPKDTIPPFDHSGKPAVRARVFNVNGKDTLLWLEKMTPAGKKSLEAQQAKGSAMPASVAMNMAFSQVLVKRPGDKEWVPLVSRQADTVRDLPRNAAGEPPSEVFPLN